MFIKEKKIISSKEIKTLISSKPFFEKRLEIINELKNILSGRSSKKLVIVGPCSVDKEDALYVYLEKLYNISKSLEEKLLIIPRVYITKPRSRGEGYKGIVFNPNLEEDLVDLDKGIKKARNIFNKIALDFGFFPAVEMVYTYFLSYIDDFVSYIAIGARTAESALHRAYASGLEVPVGIKNPMSGNLYALCDSIYAVSQKKYLPINEFQYSTSGNKYVHAIFRGFVDKNNKSHANYDEDSILEFFRIARERCKNNSALIIDCSHGNSNKKSDNQMIVVKKVCERMKKAISKQIKGIMLESYIKDGNQKINENHFGVSYTDECLSLEKTEIALNEFANSF